jgi:hypothetical protein
VPLPTQRPKLGPNIANVTHLIGYLKPVAGFELPFVSEDACGFPYPSQNFNIA